MRSLVFCLALAACGPSMPKGPGATLGATPTSVSGAQPTSVLKLVTWDEDGNPGVGAAHFQCLGGALLENPDVPLTDGTATITFRCLPGSDQGCQGSVEIDASWRGVTSPAFVQVSP